MFPQEFENRMKRLLGDEFADFAASYDRPRNVGLRLNPLKTAQPPELSRFGLTPVPWEKHGYYYDIATRPGLSAYHEAGLYYLQEASAMAPAGLLDVHPGMRVLDLCAAPGGKSTQLAAALQGEGLLVCNEYNPKRSKILSRNIERLGIANALVLNEHPQKLAERFAGFFDRVLVDAPCSGEGMFRKEEAAVTDWSEQTVAMCADRQLEILRSAAKMLRPGGRLVYSTCTFAPAENEGVIAAFLKEHKEFSVQAADAPWFAPGVPQWADGNEALKDTFRLWPHKLHGEGHYAAVLTLAGEEEPEPAFREKGLPVPKELENFCRENLVEYPEGRLMSFGQTLLLVPHLMPRLDGLKVLRAGLELGELKKGRFEPAHAWALWLKTAKNTVSYPEDSTEIYRYLRGETLPGEQNGWTLVCVDGLSLGWAKGSGGVLKNHFPKALRHLG
ncbi:MAG: RsmB/NOP family class I SAM-dependent RNA methyltransferase [Oscillospiraceae bacterium]|nr:RsmB/NOP family class I SAM-dependent RNA methyltransferase [Oscillospiraceae bacterium]